MPTQCTGTVESTVTIGSRVTAELLWGVLLVQGDFTGTIESSGTIQPALLGAGAGTGYAQGWRRGKVSTLLRRIGGQENRKSA